MTENMTTTKHIAYAVTGTDVNPDQLGTQDIMVQAFTDDEGTQVYTGQDILISTADLSDTAAFVAALVEAGWHVVGQVDTQSGQTIAEVEQW